MPAVTLEKGLGPLAKADSLSTTIATDQLGQATMAQSLPVVLPSDQAVPIQNQGIAVVLTPVLTVAGAYQAGDCLGALIALTNIATANGKSIYIINSVLADKAEQTFTATLLIFNANPTGTTFTDNSAMNVVDADMAKVIGAIPFTTLKDIGGGKISIGDTSPVKITPASDSRSLWAAVIIDSGTPTFAAGDVVITIEPIRD